MENKTIDLLNEHLKKYLEETDIPNFIRANPMLNIFHFPVIIRHINNENTFTEEKPDCLHCVKLRPLSYKIKDCQIKPTELYGNYIFGYNLASYAAKSYESFKNNLKINMELVILDLQDKLNTSNKIIGQIQGSFAEMDDLPGYLLNIHATVGRTPKQVIDARYDDPENYTEFNLHKAWTKQ